MNTAAQVDAMLPHWLPHWHLSAACGRSELSSHFSKLSRTCTMQVRTSHEGALSEKLRAVDLEAPCSHSSTAVQQSSREQLMHTS